MLQEVEAGLWDILGVKNRSPTHKMPVNPVNPSKLQPKSVIATLLDEYLTIPEVFRSDQMPMRNNFDYVFFW